MRITTLTLILVGLLAWPFDAKAKALEFDTGHQVLKHCKRLIKLSGRWVVDDSPQAIAEIAGCGW